MARDDERCGECHSMNLKVVNIRDIFHPSHKGPVIAICSEGDREVAEIADDMITVPDVVEYLQPIIVSIPLNCWRTKSPCYAVAMWTNRGTWRRA